MAYYKICAACGAHLDPGEKCECNKKGLPQSDGNSPKNNGPSTSSIISQNSEDVKTHFQKNTDKTIDLQSIFDTRGSMLDNLRRVLRETEEAIEYAEACDHTYTRYYAGMCKARESLLKTIKKFEKTERDKLK